MNENTKSDHVRVLTTGKLFEHDIATSALEENGVPFYKEFETSSGLRLAMPFQPAMAPGCFYSVFVPTVYADEAKEILNGLPIDVTMEPDIWHFGANEKAKKTWKFIAWIVLIITLLGFLKIIL